MKDVLFTQYMLPDGHKVERLIERPDDTAAQADELAKVGVVLEMEMLRDMATVSFTAERPTQPHSHILEVQYCAKCEDEVLASEVVPNGLAVPEAVDRLITTAYDAVIGR